MPNEGYPANAAGVSINMIMQSLPRVSRPLAAGLVILLAGQARPAVAAKARVQLVSSVKAVAAGEAFDVAVKFTIDKGWHIYWMNAGDAGLPPKVEWMLPDGFSAGELRFPIPKRHVDKAALVTNILEGEPVLLATITPPKSIGSITKITIGADLKWLVCEEQCLMERQSVSLSLPVAGTAEAVEYAEEKLFRRARRAMPVPAERAKYVKLTPSIANGRLAASATFDVLLDVEIKHGFHIQSNRPLTAGLVATNVFMAPVKELFFDPPVFPKPKIRMVPSFGKISEFAGRISIRVPVEVDDKLPGDSRAIGGLFVYQACSENGTCFPREGVEWSFIVPIGHADAAHAHETLVQGSAPPTDRLNPVAPEPDAPAVGNLGPTPSAPANDGDPIQQFLERFGLVGLLAGCFLYGLFINATPCVLPLLSIKVLGFVQQAHESRRRTLFLGLAFGAGVMVFFVVLGLFASRGKNVLQYPVAVIALSTIVMALALSMLGVYTLQVPTAATKLDARIQQEGILSSFGKGALAPVLGFACTGPLLAGAFGWATQQPPNVAILAFVVMGFGMASPYMLLGANPNWLGFLPKPGQWMITFERVMGFLLLAMVVWLLHPIGARFGTAGLEWTLVFLVIVAMACWVLGKIDLMMAAAKRWSYRGSAATLVAVAALFVFGWAFPAAGNIVVSADGIHWSKEAVAKSVRAGNTVFVDFTASYCTVCKANKAIAINTPEAVEKMESLGVVRFKGDFSTGDPEIFEMLQAHGRAGVPLNLIYPAGKPDNPIVLRPSLTKAYFIKKLTEAGPSRPVPAK